MQGLVERSVPWRRLVDDYDEARRRRTSRLVVLDGPTGIGKTALLDAFARRLGGRPVLRGRAEALESGTPYGAIRHALHRLGQHEEVAGRVAIAASRSVPDPGTSADESLLVLKEIRELLATLSDGTNPAVMILDDLHEADRATAALIVRLLRTASSSTPVFILAARRPDPRGDTRQLGEMLTRMTQDGYATSITLDPLSRAGVRQLGGLILDMEPTWLLSDYVHQATQGSPFSASRLYARLAAQGNIEFGEQADLVPRSMAARVDEAAVAAGDLPALSPAQERTATAVSVLGRMETADLRLLAELAELDEADTRLTLLELVDLGLLVDKGSDGLEFTHPQLRAMVYNRVASARLARLHDRVASYLTANSDRKAIDPFSYASHLHRGVAASAEQRRTSAITAAEHAFMSAPLVAEYWLGRAIETLPPGDERRVVLLWRRAQACLLGTATNEAIEHCRQALDEAGPELYRDELVTLTAWALFFSGAFDQTEALVRSEFAQYPSTVGNVSSAMAFAAEMFEKDQAAWLFPLGVAASKLEHPSSLVTVKIPGELFIFANQCDLPERDQLWQQALAQVPGLPSGYAAETLYGFSMFVGGHAGAVREAEAAIVRADEIRGLRHAMSAWGFSEMALGSNTWLRGEWDDTLDLAEEVVAADEIGGNAVAAQLVRSVATIVHLHRGDRARAEHFGAAIWARLPASFHVQGTLARSMVLRDDASALEVIAESIALYRRAGFSNLVGALVDEAERRSPSSGLALGHDLPPLPELAAEMLAATHNELNRLWLQHVLGRVRQDADALEQALAIAVAEGLRFEEGRILVSLGKVLQNPQPIVRAAEIFGALKAHPWQADAAKSARDLGVRMYAPRKRRSAFTEVETAVGRKAVQGLSNPQIAGELAYSVKRVESVLTAVFRKAGVRSRYELITAAHENPRLFEDDEEAT